MEETVSLNDVERQVIVRALEKNRGKRRKAAQELNSPERTLYRKIKEYGWIKRIFESKVVGLLSCVFLLAACSISYKFNGASIDYTKTKTIQISPFPIRSAYVWRPCSLFSATS